MMTVMKWAFIGGIVGFFLISLPLVIVTAFLVSNPIIDFLLGMVEGGGGYIIGMLIGGNYGLYKEYPEFHESHFPWRSK